MEDDLFDFSEKPFVYSNEQKEKITTRYSREKRLRNAPENVRKMHDGVYTKRPGLIGALFASKANAMLAILILLMMVFMFFYGKIRDTKELENFKLIMSVEFNSENSLEDNTIFVNVTIKPKTKDFYGEEIKLMFFAFDENDAVLGYKTLSSVYLAEEQILSSRLQLRAPVKNLKKVKAQVELSEKIYVLEKKIRIK